MYCAVCVLKCVEALRRVWCERVGALRRMECGRVYMYVMSGLRRMCA